MRVLDEKIEILIPVYNEADSIDEFFKIFSGFISSLKAMYPNVITHFLDNCSTDGTFEILETKCSNSIEQYKITSWVRNYGVMVSVFGGMTDSKADVVFILDFDLQDPPELIYEMLEWRQKGYLLVTGQRVTRIENKSLTILRNTFKLIHRVLGSKKNSRIESGFWLIDKLIIWDLKANPPVSKHLAGTIESRGYKHRMVPYSRRARLSGESKFNFARYLGYAFEGLVAVPSKLVRFIMLNGLILIMFTSFVLVFLLIQRFILHSIESTGLTLIILFQFVSLAFSALIMGLVGELLVRVFINTAKIEKPIAHKVIEVY
jgi:dolichol-phosphate mannosyltransferase